MQPVGSSRMRRAVVLLAVLSGGVSCGQQDPLAPSVPPPVTNLRWYKGNTHTHTLNSDGDTDPNTVVRWYHANGYQFLIVSDHNVLTDVGPLNAEFAEPGRFLLIGGEEISNLLPGRPLDVTAVGIARAIPRQFAPNGIAILQRSVDAVRAVGAVPIINHPNFYGAISGDDIDQLRDVRLFELYNGVPYTLPFGGEGLPSMETVWDRLLARGKLLYGVAADDAHLFQRPLSQEWASPGKGWVMVRTLELSQDSILAALDRGDFYSSTGIALDGYEATDSTMSVWATPKSGRPVRVEFIGRGGVLYSTTSSPAVYRFAGDEGYVRARAIGADGTYAWMQPVWVVAR
jgi:hypothetical protein